MADDWGSGERMDSPSVRTYAQFGRRSGGLLYVLQALLFLSQGAILRVAESLLPQSLMPLLLLPLYAAYFIVRDPLWLRLYRPRGHLDEVSAIKEARTNVWVLLVVSLFIALWSGPSGAQVLAMLGWTALFWGILAARGRLPADGAVFIFTIVFFLNNRSLLIGSLRWPVLVAPALYVAVGVYEHLLFMRAERSAKSNE